MKTIERSVTFLIFSVLIGLILYFHYSTPPITAIPSRSMVPVFHVGDLVLIHPIQPEEVKNGDILVVDVPKSVRQRFGYPPNIIHRVVKIEHVAGNLQFRVKGDNNNAQDPFTVLPQDIMGEAGRSFRYLGYPILFINSKQGLIFIVTSLILYCLFVMYDELKRRDVSFRKGVTSLFFREVLQQTDRIEQSQSAIIDLLKSGNTDWQKETAMTFESQNDLLTLKRKLEESRFLVESIRLKKESSVSSEELLHLFNQLEAKISEVIGSAEDQAEEKELPSRKSTRKRRRFF